MAGNVFSEDRLTERFPDIGAAKIAAILRENNGHAGLRPIGVSDFMAGFLTGYWSMCVSRKMMVWLRVASHLPSTRTMASNPNPNHQIVILGVGWEWNQTILGKLQKPLEAQPTGPGPF